MKANLIKYYHDVLASYWFVPTLMVLSAIAFSAFTIFIDSRIGLQWMVDLSWSYANGPEGARSVLSTIAGSMITVAGVTFSMTIVSVSYASSQFGPRLIGNFMRDRGNQITLGTFIATFVYCLLILRTVRAEDEISGYTGDAISAFVPHLSVLFALLFALASVAVLIYFIHHIPETINVSNIISGVGRELQQKINILFPAEIGDQKNNEQESINEPCLPERFYEDAAPVLAGRNGYIQAMDEDRLLGVAVRYDLIIRLEYRPGDFALDNKILLLAWPGENVTEAVSDDLRAAFAWGTKRTPLQNVIFVVDELAEIIARALSPGVNDPFTAMSCIDWYQIALQQFSQREIPDASRYDDNKHLRVIAYPVTFERFASAIFDQTRPYVAADRNVALHMMQMIAEVASEQRNAEYTEILLKHARALSEAGSEALALDIDRKSLSMRYEQLKLIIEDPLVRDHLRDSQAWFGGQA